MASRGVRERRVLAVDDDLARNRRRSAPAITRASSRATGAEQASDAEHLTGVKAEG